jgi:hypothetical protein
MKRRHSITPTDAGKPLLANPAWSYSPPERKRITVEVINDDGEIERRRIDVVEVDATVLTSVTAHNVAAEKCGNGRGWGRG